MAFKKILFTLLVPFSNSLFGQDIIGIWEGNYIKAGYQPDKLIVEITDSKSFFIQGESHLYFPAGYYQHYLIKGNYNKSDSTIYFKEDSTIVSSIRPDLYNCPGNYKMKLSVTDSFLILKGYWQDNYRGFFNCKKSGVYLKKRIKKTDIENKQNLIPVLLRETNVQRIIDIDKESSDSLKIEIYDNGIVDNDTISLYYNDNLIASKKLITTEPILFYISLQKEYPINKLKLIAENLGLYPPCTALMIITTKKNRYEVFLSSSLSQNAAVEFFLKE